MRFDKRLVFASILLAVSVCPAGAQTVTNHAFAIGRGLGQSGYTSALCTSAQLAVGQAAADPICQTITGDMTISAGGVTAIGASKVLNAQLATMAANTTKCNATAGTANPTDCTAATMRTNLALVPGTNVEAWDADLDALAALAGTGIARRTATNTWSVGTAVTNAELATMTANTIKGNATAGSATPTDLAMPSCSGANQAVNWTSGTGLGCVTISAGASPSVTTKTANYTIAVGDCGSRIEGSGGPWTLTLPAVAGFSAGCQVQVCNTDPNDNTHHAIRLSGWPAPSLARLWMGQCQTVSLISGGTAWTISSFPGKFRPNFAPTVFIDTGGSALNDGLISNAAGNALRNVQDFFNLVKFEWDSMGLIPQGNMTTGQSFSGCPIYGYRDAGVVYLIGNGGNATMTSTCNVVLELSDFGGYVILSNVTLDCTGAASHPCTNLFMHQQNGVDLSNGAAPSANAVTFIGGQSGASGDTAIWCDSQCKINAAQPIIFGGSFKTLIGMDYGSMAQINNGVTFQNGLTVTGQGGFRAWRGSTMGLQGTMAIGTTVNFGNGIFDASDMGQFILSSSFAVTGTLGTGRQWTILNNSFLCNDSATAIPGTAGLNTSTAAHSAGTVVGTSGDNCYVSFP